MLLIMSTHEWRAHDSHFLLRAILDYPHKNMYDFEGARELVTCEHQVAFEVYRICVCTQYNIIDYSIPTLVPYHIVCIKYQL